MNSHGLRTDKALPRARRRNIIEQRENGSIECYADESHHFRAVTADFSVQRLPSFSVFRRPKVIDTRARPRNQIGYAEVPFEEPIVILVRNPLRRQPRIT